MGDLCYGRELLAGEYGPGARDQRLEGFAQGGWADVAAGSGWLGLQAGDVSRPEVLGQATDDEVLGIGRAWRALEAWSFAGKLAVVRELIRRHPLREYDEPGLAAGGLPQDWDPRLHHEVAAALGISLAAAGKLVNIAWTLEARLPGIGRALAASKLDPGRVKMIVDATAVLEREDMFGRAEQLILAWPAGLHDLVGPGAAGGARRDRRRPARRGEAPPEGRAGGRADPFLAGEHRSLRAGGHGPAGR